MDNQNQNEFNNAIGYIMRLDKIFYLIAQNKIDNNLIQYLESLRLLYHELSTEMEIYDSDNIKNKIRDIKQELININVQKINNIPETILEDMEDIELELRSIYKKSGLQMKTKKKAGFDLE